MAYQSEAELENLLIKQLAGGRRIRGDRSKRLSADRPCKSNRQRI